MLNDHFDTLHHNHTFSSFNTYTIFIVFSDFPSIRNILTFLIPFVQPNLSLITFLNIRETVVYGRKR